MEKESTQEKTSKETPENEMIFHFCMCVFWFLARIIFFMTMFHSPHIHKFDDKSQKYQENLCISIHFRFK